ncbi:MAG: hypothetical protein ACUVQ1_09010 [Candidatus Kapaibacteriales bacterium]
MFIKYSAFNIDTFPFKLIFAGGVKLLIGDFLKEKDGVQLSIDIQSGRGSLDFIF